MKRFAVNENLTVRFPQDKTPRPGWGVITSKPLPPTGRKPLPPLVRQNDWARKIGRKEQFQVARDILERVFGQTGNTLAGMKLSLRKVLARHADALTPREFIIASIMAGDNSPQ